MEQFSHDLTLALEESSRGGGVDRGCWGLRRRTRSTGNLPLACAPLPTEDSSSSPPDCSRPPGAPVVVPPHSDSDEVHAQRLNLKSHTLLQLHSGHFESDSFNENFSPTRPNTRRKRKFKRMAVEYETTTPSTPNMTSVVFPNMVTATTKKKRVLKHTCQENFKANLFFCGKRKRSHRERSIDCDMREAKGHRPSYIGNKGSYLEYKTCKNRHPALKLHEKILPLNKSIVSKIEQISKESLKGSQFEFHCQKQKPSVAVFGQTQNVAKMLETNLSLANSKAMNILKLQPVENKANIFQKSGSLESTFAGFDVPNFSGLPANKMETKLPKCDYNSDKKHIFKNPYSIQFEDAGNLMDCVMSEFLSSSSLSSSDSEAILTNESDREGDDELTDWPGNEAMVLMSQRNLDRNLKMKLTADKAKNKISFQKAVVPDLAMDDDTMMSDTTVLAPNSGDFQSILPPTDCAFSPIKQPMKPGLFLYNTSPLTSPSALESSKSFFLGGSLSGEGSMGDVSSDAMNSLDVREIRAGCRRIRDERPGFSILTSANEHLSRFLQDRHQTELHLGQLDASEAAKMQSLAVLYSLNMSTSQGVVQGAPAGTVLTKTSNTMQAVKVEQSHITRRLLSDYKRRCYSVPGAECVSEPILTMGDVDFASKK